MSLLLSAIGFCAQLIAIASIISVIISSVCLSSADSAFISEDHPTGAELSAMADDLLQSMIDILDDDSNATLSDTARVACAKSMASPVYVTTIDEPSVPPDDYSAMTVVALKALCKSQGVKGYSSLRRHELVALLSAL
jgi:hypothetical protein